MDAKTLEALRGSIAKWEGIVAGTGVDDGPHNCPLCQLFHASFGGKESPERCYGCPVKVATGLHGCHGTPYDDYEDISNDADSVDYGDDSEAAAQAELDFLKSLLPDVSSVSNGECT